MGLKSTTLWKLNVQQHLWVMGNDVHCLKKTWNFDLYTPNWFHCTRARSIALYMSHIEHVWIKSLEFVGVITINLIGSFLCRLQIRYAILYGPQCTTALCLFINEFNNCVQILTPWSIWFLAPINVCRCFLKRIPFV